MIRVMVGGPRTAGHVAVILFLAVMCASCGREPQAPKSRHAHTSAPGVQSLDAYADANGAIHVLTAETDRGDDSPVLVYRRSEDGGENWGSPVRVDAGCLAPHQPRHGMDPQIAARRNRVVAVWTAGGTGFGGSGPMATAVSEDGGKTWQAGSNPADDGSTGGHSFIDAAADSAGFHLVWLDDRQGARGLRYAFSDDGREWFENATIDSETCECCWNTLSILPDGKIVVLYRDKNPRDMAIAASADGGATWRRIGAVGDFLWQFNGCPHVGGGLTFARDAARNLVLHAVVWTGKQNQAGVYYLNSVDGGRFWNRSKRHSHERPRANVTRLGDTTARYADIASGTDGRLAAVWSMSDGESAAVFGAISADGGMTWSGARKLSVTGRRASHPKVVWARSAFRVFWSETNADGADGMRSSRMD